MLPVIDTKNELLPFAAEIRPIEVIVLIFNKVSLEKINRTLFSLFRAAYYRYSTDKERDQLRYLYYWQKVLYQALYTIYSEKNLPANEPNQELLKLQTAFKQIVVTKTIPDNVLQDPTLIIRELLSEGPDSYARLRLWDWFERAESNHCHYLPDEERDAFSYYYVCAGLVAAAYALNKHSRGTQ